MLELYGQIEEAVAAIRAKWDTTPRAGIILGTGLGSFVKENEEDVSLAY
ncbi:MAG TPA: purine-nucleoside phosphorylase, partial [Planctomycetaceae bacterium]|nr:purine-nucleoside phosphorylase [Planctomycetaceae bacterium]